MPTSRTAFFLVSLLTGLAAGPGLAEDGPVHLVDDLVDAADAAAGLDPSFLTPVGDKLIFVGWNPLTGREPWTSDGTPEGTRMVADTCPGPCGIFSLVPLGDAVYFESCDGVRVCQLWRSDGTPEGTAAITRYSRQGSRVFHLTPWNGALYFVASDAVHGAELRRSDGTAAGTGLVADLGPGPADAGIRRLAAADDRLYFEAGNGGEIWTSDGTEDGTARVGRLAFGQSTTSPILTAGTRAFFVERFFDLWTSDGTEAGTRQIAASNQVITLLVTFGGDLYFSRLADSSSEQELWISDGSAAGTRRLRGGFPFLAQPSSAVPFRGELYFAARDELWKTDGTAVGTVRIADLEERIFDLGVGGSGRLLVGSAGGLRRLEEDGTLRLLSDAFSARGFAPFRDGAAFAAASDAAGAELAVAGGDETAVLSDVVDPGSSRPVELTATGDELVFTDSLFPVGVYRSDGTAPGTRRLGVFEAFEALFEDRIRTAEAGGRAFLLEDDLQAVRPGGLVRLLDDLPEGASQPRWLLRGTAAAFGGRLVFLVWNFENDRIELWSSNGTRAGTRRLDELMPFGYCFLCDPPAPLPTFGVVPADGRLFVYFDGRLWASDGSPGGAVEVDLGGLCDPCDLGPAAAVGDRLFFGSAGSPFFGPRPDPRRLWVSDGTAAGTAVVREFAPARPGGLAAPMDGVFGAGDTLFFTVETPGLGDELWRSDGTAAGTLPVSDLRPGGESSNPRGLAFLGGELYFAADDGVHGRELWATDGTPRGTRLVADLRPGGASSFPSELAAIDGRLHFAADDGIAGLEPWTSDGTADGTRRLADVEPGPLPSSPSSFRAAGSRVFFSAGTGDAGFELRATPRESCEDCLLGGRFRVTAAWTEDGVTTPAEPVPFSDETLLFWFFERSNTELLVKVLDGRPLNGHVWVFFGALSDLEYEIRVEDRFTGAVRTYRNPPGELCGRADVLAFRDGGPFLGLPAPRADRPAGDPPQDRAAGPCPSDPKTLCLRSGRFGVEVDWKNQHAGGATGSGRAIPDTDETGYFWFFDDANLELAVKLLDGRPLNGKFWFFYGALSDTEYAITLTDWQTGAVRTYRNPPGELCGGADIDALDP